MKKNINAFTLIEVIIATSILTVAVFGVYKLIGENTKLINNSNNYITSRKLFPITTECLENKGFNTFLNKNIGYHTGIYLGNTLTGCTLINSGNIINNLIYYLDATITNTGTNLIEWKIQIKSDGINSFSGKYIQIKR